MELRAGDGLLLHQKPGANFDLPTDSIGIDSLVADSLHGMRPYDLPVIIFGALIDRLHRLPVRQSKQVEFAVAVDIGGVKYQRGANRGQRGELAIAVA